MKIHAWTHECRKGSVSNSVCLSTCVAGKGIHTNLIVSGRSGTTLEQKRRILYL